MVNILLNGSKKKLNFFLLVFLKILNIIFNISFMNKFEYIFKFIYFFGLEEINLD